MPTFAQTAFVILVCTLLPLAEAPFWHRLRINSTGETRLKLYRKMLVVLWLMAAMAAWLAFPAAMPGVEWPLAARAAVLGAVVLLSGLQLWQVLRCAANEKLRHRLAAAARPLQFMLPVGITERRWWIALAISAGVCEEFVFRGFMVQYFAAWQLGLPMAWLLSCIAFGFGHAYQGRAAVVRTALIGGLFGLVVIASGGLALAILLHAVMDLLPLAYSEGIAEVGEQVGGVLDADGNADQAIGDPH